MHARWVVAGAIGGLGLLGASVPLVLQERDASPLPHGVAMGVDVIPDAIHFDEATATLVAQDESARVWTDAAGVGKVEISLLPVRVYREGKWIAASSELSEAGDVLVAASHPLEPTFPAELGVESRTTVTTGGFDISFVLEGQKPGVRAVTESGSERSGITYENAIGDADLAYEVVPGQVKESFVVSERPGSPLSFSWRIDAPGLSFEPNEFGGIDFVSPIGEVVANVPPPVMWDSAGEPDNVSADLVNVDFTIDELGNGEYRFTLVPDPAWLADPARQYPVTIDPTVASGSTSYVAIKFDGATYAGLRIGNPAQSSGWTAWRSVAMYPYLGTFGSGASQVKLSEKRIVGASLSTTVTGGTANCYDGGLWGVTSIAYSGIGEYLSEFPNCATGDANGTKMAALFAAANARNLSGVYVMLAGDEGYAYSYKQLSSTMTFTYVERAKVTGVTGASPYRATTTDPMPLVFADDTVLQAVGTFGTNTGGQQFRYTIKLPNGGSWVSPWVEAGPYRVPDTVLAPATDYSYSIETRDKHTYESPVTSLVDNAKLVFRTRGAPPAPTNLTVGGLVPAQPAVVTTSQPTLSANVSSTDGSDVWALFTVTQDGIVVAESLPGEVVEGVASGTAAGPSSVQLPFPLVPGATYQVTVQTFNGHVASPPLPASGYFQGPPRSDYIEIPGTDDTNLGAGS